MTYYFAKALPVGVEEALPRVIDALKQEGFGVLTQIDVKATMKEKLGVEFRDYRILGACNPTLAHEALQFEDKVGTMLPCNVVVQATGPGSTEVAVIDPVASMQAIDNPRLKQAAEQVRVKLKRVVESSKSARWPAVRSAGSGPQRQLGRRAVRQASLSRIAQYLNRLFHDVDPNGRTHDQVEIAKPGKQHRDTRDNYRNVCDHIGSGENPRRPDVDFVLPLAAKKAQDHRVHCKGGRRYDNHPNALRLPTRYEALDDLNQHAKAKQE